MVDNSPEILLTFSVILLGAGLILWRIGKFGKRIDRHPICRKCGFDLYGSYRLDYTCSECGARTFPPDGIRVGNRREVAWLVYGGVFLLILGVCGAFVAAPSTFDVEATARHKPALWLRVEAKSNNLELRSAALKELTRRIYAGEAGLEEITPLIDSILAIQADPSTEWVTEWGDFVELARSKNLVNSNRWQAYLDNCVRAEYSDERYSSLRPKMRMGTTQRFQIGFSGNMEAADDYSSGFNGRWPGRRVLAEAHVDHGSPLDAPARDDAQGSKIAAMLRVH